MKVLNLTGRGLTTLEGIDLTGVTHLQCDGNKLSSLPERLPDTIMVIYCGSNKLTSLPAKLPRELYMLHCDYNNLTSLPDVLPEKLDVLYCPFNKLTSLPKRLPHNLSFLDCRNNNLRYLPFFPVSLQYLACSNNYLPENAYHKILLQQHNQKRRDLGLPIVEKLEEDWDIRHRWTLLQYELDSEEYNKAEREMIQKN